MIRPSVSTPSTSSNNSWIFFALARTLGEIGFTDKLDPGLEDVVKMNDADGLGAASFKDKQRGDRPRRVSFHHRHRLGGQDIFFDRAWLRGHDFVGSLVEYPVAMGLQAAA